MRKLATRIELGMSFEMQTYVSLPDLRKLGYVANMGGIAAHEIARIIGENPHTVIDTLTSGHVPSHLRNADEVFDKLYLLLMLFSSLLRLSGYSDTELKRILDDKTDFRECTEPPPWYPYSLRDVILRGKMDDIRTAVQWLREH